MTNTEIPRLFLDHHFILEILKDKDEAMDIILKLSKIHFYDGTHQNNIIFDESFKESIKEKEIRGNALLGAMHPVNPDYLSEDDFHTKVIKYCIDVATKRPYRVIILTSKNEKQNYLENTHYKDNGSVKGAIKIFSNEEINDSIDVILDTLN